jgi:hypothetical protein
MAAQDDVVWPYEIDNLEHECLHVLVACISEGDW